MQLSVSEQELRNLIKLIVQTGTCDQSNLVLSPEQQQRITLAHEIYQRRDKSKPLRGEFSGGVPAKVDSEGDLLTAANDWPVKSLRV